MTVALAVDKTLHTRGDVAAMAHKSDARGCVLRGYKTVVKRAVYGLTVDWSALREINADGLSGNPFNILLYAEAIRQAGLVIPHIGFDVPADWKFVLNEMNIRVEPYVSDRAVETAHAVVVCRDVRLRHGKILESMTIDVFFYDGLLLLARGQGSLRVLPPSLYQHLRARAQIKPESSAGRFAIDVGVPDLYDAHAGLISHTRSGQARLMVDQSHPVFFDHPCDHVPGMMIMAGCRQLALRSHPALVVHSLDAKFTRYVELKPHPVLEVIPSETDTAVSIQVQQPTGPSSRPTVAATVVLNGQ